MAGQIDFLGAFIASNGAPLGIAISGFTLIPWGGGMGGLVMSDANGNFWLMQIDTDGRLSTSQVSF